MLISLHLPKTAGGGFGQALSVHFGDALQFDSSDLPLNTSRSWRNDHAEKMRAINAELKPDEYVCIHGYCNAGEPY